MSKNTLDPIDQTRPADIFVAYPWSKDEASAVVAPRADIRWKSIQKQIEGAVAAVEKSAAKRPATRPFNIHVRRLRGRHGQFLLFTLLERLKNAELLVMDIGSSDGDGFNQNVLVELGMAIGLDKLAAVGIFILMPKGLLLPSDLQGFLYSAYELNADGEIKFVDPQGFHAAIRSSIRDIARRKGMLGYSRDNDEEEEVGSENAKPITAKSRRGKGI